MFFSSLFSKKLKKKTTNALLLDLGSGSLGAVLVSCESGGDIKVITTARQEFPLQEKVTFDRFNTALKEVSIQLFNALIVSGNTVVPDQVLISIASPWHSSQTRVVHFEQTTEFLVSFHSMRELIEKEAEAFIDSSSRIGGIFERSVLIEPQVMQIKVNGYKSESPIGKYAKSIDVAVHYAAVPESIHTLLSEEVTKRFGNMPIKYVTYMFGASVVARDAYASTPSFLVVDLASEVTDVGLVHDGVLVETVSFPQGTSSLVRGIVETLSLSPYIAESELRAHIEGHLIGERASKIDASLDESVRRWSQLFQDSLSYFTQKYPLPNDIFLITQQSTESYFKGELTKPILDKIDLTLSGSGTTLKVKDFSPFLISGCKDAFLCVMIVLYRKQLSSELKRI